MLWEHLARSSKEVKKRNHRLEREEASHLRSTVVHCKNVISVCVFMLLSCSNIFFACDFYLALIEKKISLKYWLYALTEEFYSLQNAQSVSVPCSLIKISVQCIKEDS